MPLKTFAGCLHGRKLQKCRSGQRSLFRGRTQATRVFMGRGLGGFIMVSLRIAAVRWAIGVFICLGVSHVPTNAVAQGVAGPAAGSGIPMPRPPQRSGQQVSGVGTPGQMNTRLASPSLGGGTPANNASPAGLRGSGLVGPRSSSTLSSVNGSRGMLRSGATMAGAPGMRASRVSGYGSTRQQSR